MSPREIINENGNLFEFPQKAYKKAVLEIVEKNVEGKDIVIVCSAGSNKGDNYLGIVYRIDVKDKNDANIKLSFVLKSAPQNEARREEFFAHAAFERESLFYEEVLPLYKKFQDEKGIDVEKEGFNGVAHCYKALHEEPSEGLIFDNLKVKGYEMFDRHVDLTKDYVILTMKALGKLHALFYSLKDQKPELVQKFQDIDDLLINFCNDGDSSIRIMMETQKEMAIKLIKKSNNQDMVKRVLNILNNDIRKQLREAVRGDKAEPYATLCHGDCWNNNIMYLTDEDGVPRDLKLLDFQIMRYASPACDLSYYLFGCTTKELRDKHYNEFLDAYYESLSSFMIKLGSSPGEIFPRKALDDQMKEFGRFGLLMGIIIIPFFVTDPEDAPDFDLIATSYKESQRDPSKKFDLSLVEFKSENKRAKYEERMMGVFEDLYDFGYI